MKVVAVIQARMNSTRLPGKILNEVAGRSLLQWQIKRIQHSRMIDKLCVATTNSSPDDKVEELCTKLDVPCFRGSEDDVLDRMYKAALEFKPDHIVRLTGDCPLLDADICDKLIELHLQEGSDYANTAETFAEGLDCEVMKFSVLEEAWRKARMASEREHVTLYIRNSGDYRCIQLNHVRDDSKYRITVDEPSDYALVSNILSHLPHPETDNFDIVRKYIDKHPEIFELNSDVIRNEGLLKSLAEDHVYKQGPDS